MEITGETPVDVISMDLFQADNTETKSGSFSILQKSVVAIAIVFQASNLVYNFQCAHFSDTLSRVIILAALLIGGKSILNTTNAEKLERHHQRLTALNLELAEKKAYLEKALLDLAQTLSLVDPVIEEHLNKAGQNKTDPNFTIQTLQEVTKVFTHILKNKPLESLWKEIDQGVRQLQESKKQYQLIQDAIQVQKTAFASIRNSFEAFSDRLNAQCEGALKVEGNLNGSYEAFDASLKKLFSHLETLSLNQKAWLSGA